jgi:outer membrane murein-binding lipoprotein Lpp
MRRILAGALFLALGAAPLVGDASDAVKAELARERRRLASDSRTLTDVSRRLESALNQLASASRAVAETAARGDSGPDEMTRREDAVSESEQEVRALLEKRRLVADRIVERRRSIVALEAEITTKKPDAVTGRWAVTLDPGSQRGVFRMNLDGTIVSGEYTLDGGYSGSLRGTLVADRLRMERVDSRLGFSAVFYGRVARDQTSIAGTWEATSFGDGAATSGVWKAVREEEKEENP